MIPSSLWIVFTLCASALQVTRSAMQRSLTASLGTVGATHVRFLFGFPASLVLLAVVLMVTGAPLPEMKPAFWLWLPLAAFTQIAGTALMLAAMEQRSFVVATAFVKTEPVQVAVFGLIFLGDQLTFLGIGAIVLATVGVILMAVQPGRTDFSGTRSIALGLGSAAMFAMSAVGFRGAVLTIDARSVVAGASYMLVLSLMMQTVVLTAWLWLRDRKALFEIFRLWRPSLLAGCIGACASQFWFMAFALTSAANVRTLALVEVLFAQAISYYSFRQGTSAREIFGIVLIVIGVGVLVATH
jgi:drug/metabolite transporter (DMT)-like permease